MTTTPQPAFEPLPETPEHPPVDPQMERVEMFEAGGLDSVFEVFANREAAVEHVGG